MNQGVQQPPFGKNSGQQNGYPAGPGPGRGSRPPDAPSPASGDGNGSAGAPRQLTNVKGAGGSMGPPASPSLANRHVGGVKKSESANSSPALASSTVPNGMGDRSRTPSGQQQQQQGKPPSPRTGPATRPQSAAPSTNQGSMMQAPAPSTSAPPMLPPPTQSPSNGMMPPFKSFPPNGSFGGPGGEFDFGPILDFAQLTDEFFPESVDQILNMSSLNEWPNDDSSLPTD